MPWTSPAGSVRWLRRAVRRSRSGPALSSAARTWRSLWSEDHREPYGVVDADASLTPPWPGLLHGALNPSCFVVGTEVHRQALDESRFGVLEGETMAWCRTEGTLAYVGDRPVVESMAAELTEIVGPEVYGELRRRIDD